jgi:hypothetical protein
MAEHFDGKSPFILSQTPWSPPKKRNRDVITVKHDPIWSDMRTEAIGRRVWSYSVTNETKGSEYSTELFEGISGEPCAVCNCPSSVVCKHLLNAMADLIENHCPEFGEGFDAPAIDEARRLAFEGGL